MLLILTQLSGIGEGNAVLNNISQLLGGIAQGASEEARQGVPEGAEA